MKKERVVHGPALVLDDDALAAAQLQLDAQRAKIEDKEEEENEAGVAAQLQEDVAADQLERVFNFGMRDESP